MRLTEEPRIAVIGLGYVGLPLAVSLADHFETIGFDIDSSRIEELRQGRDRTNEIREDRSSPLVSPSPTGGMGRVGPISTS